MLVALLTVFAFALVAPFHAIRIPLVHAEGPTCCDTPLWYADHPNSNNGWIFTQDSQGPSCVPPVGFDRSGNSNGCGVYSSVDTCNPHCINYFAPWDTVRFHFDYWVSQNPLWDYTNHISITRYFELSGLVNGVYWNSGPFPGGTNSICCISDGTEVYVPEPSGCYSCVEGGGIVVEFILPSYSSHYPPQAGTYTLGALIQITDTGTNGHITYYCTSGFGSLTGSPNYCAAEVVITFHTT